MMGAHAAVVDALDRFLRKKGAVPLAWYEALALLAQARPGALRMQELAEHLVLSKSGVTRLVDRMERAGLIERTSCPEDRRGVYALLTDAGREELRASEPHVLAAVEEHFSRHITDEAASVLRACLSSVLAANGYQPHAYGSGSAKRR